MSTYQDLIAVLTYIQNNNAVYNTSFPTDNHQAVAVSLNGNDFGDQLSRDQVLLLADCIRDGYIKVRQGDRK